MNMYVLYIYIHLYTVQSWLDLGAISTDRPCFDRTRTGLGNLKVMDKLISFWLRFLYLMFLLTANLHQYHSVGLFFSTRFFIVKCSPNSTSRAQGFLQCPPKTWPRKVEYHHFKPLKWCLTPTQGGPVHPREPMAIPAYIGAIEDCSTGPGHATWQRSSLILCVRKDFLMQFFQSLPTKTPSLWLGWISFIQQALVAVARSFPFKKIHG